MCAIMEKYAGYSGRNEHHPFAELRRSIRQSYTLKGKVV
jgi:hypothetical protein